LINNNTKFHAIKLIVDSFWVIAHAYIREQVTWVIKGGKIPSTTQETYFHNARSLELDEFVGTTMEHHPKTAYLMMGKCLLSSKYSDFIVI